MEALLVCRECQSISTIIMYYVYVSDFKISDNCYKIFLRRDKLVRLTKTNTGRDWLAYTWPPRLGKEGTREY